MSKRKQSKEPAGRAAGKRPALPEAEDDLAGLVGDEDEGLGLEDVLDSDALGEELGDDDGTDGLDEAAMTAALEAGGESFSNLMPGGESEDGESEAPVSESEDDGEVELPVDVEQLGSAAELDFREVALTSKQARRVAQLLAENDKLTTVTFESHKLQVTDLRDDDELEWDSEEIGDPEAIIIAELLKNNTTLKRLDLARNLISDDGARALAAMLRSNKHLEYLNMESNDIAEKGLQGFMSALPENTTLQYLNLKENAFTSSSQQDMRDVWTRCRTSLTGLHL